MTDIATAWGTLLRRMPRWITVLTVPAIGSALFVYIVTRRIPAFFRIDDAANEYLPYFHEMGRLWLQGQLPILSTSSFSGGNLLVEFQRSVFNPISIVTAIFSGLTDNAYYTALFFAALVIYISYVGHYWLARVIGLSFGYAHLVALTVSLAPVFLYMYAASWWNAAMSMALLPFAVASLLKVFERRTAMNAVRLTLTTALFLTAGWPHGYVFYFLLCIVLALSHLTYRGADGFLTRMTTVATAAVSVFLGTLMIVPIFSEYVANSPSIARLSQVDNVNNNGIPSWNMIFTIASPISGDFMHEFGSYQWFALAFGFVSMAVLSLAFSEHLRSALRERPAIILSIVATLCFFLTQLPAQVYSIKESFRFLPYLTVTLTLLTAYLLQQTTRRWTTKRMLAIIGSAVSLSLLAAWRVPRPDEDTFHSLVMPLIYTLMVCLLLLMAYRFNMSWFSPALLSVVGIVLMLFYSPSLGGIRIAPAGVPSPDTATRAVQAARGGFLLQTSQTYSADRIFPDLNSARSLLINDLRVFNGYDPVGQRGYVDIVEPEQVQGSVPSSSLLSLLHPAQDTGGKCLTEVFGISAITLPASDLQEHPLLSSRLTNCRFSPSEISTGGTESLWLGPTPEAGLVSASDTNVHVAGVSSPSTLLDTANVENNSDQTGYVYFARMAWAGYSATLNGMAVPVDTVEGVSLRVQIPAHSEGHLVLTYHPVSWAWSVPLSVGSLLMSLTVLPLSLRLIARSKTSSRTIESPRQARK